MIGKKKVAEALSILVALGLPAEQLNERSALTLLALLDLKPRTPWPQAGAPLIGITPMMDFFAANYRKRYAPNSRETVRRFTVHQFEQAGLVRKNPDRPRAINSPDNVYQIEKSLLKVLQTFGSPAWTASLAKWQASNTQLSADYAAARQMDRIPVKLPGGRKLTLTEKGQNSLVKAVIEDFCPRFTPAATVLYVGDAGSKYALLDKASLDRLGITMNLHGKMPDVIVWFAAKKWLVLIEAVTSHGPVSSKRHKELKELFKGATAGLVFVTAFADRATMRKYLPEIAWETEVWIANAPTHLIHFNGERFLGPY